LCAYAKKNWRYTFLRSGERKATARRQVERFERTRNLDHNSADTIARQNVACGAQCIFAIRHPQQDKSFWIDANVQQSVCVWRTELHQCKVSNNPEQVSLAAKP
jgi:hypothetical protein